MLSKMESSTNADDEENYFSFLLRDYSPTEADDFSQNLLKRLKSIETEMGLLERSILSLDDIWVEGGSAW